MNFDIYLITPSFNAEATIAETIESVIPHGIKYHIRYHIQDGLSTDSTHSTLRTYEEKLKNNGRVVFSWCSRKDSGMYDAINAAVDILSIPENAWMGWINADDILVPDYLERLQQVSEALPHIQWLGGIASIANMAGEVIHPKRAGWRPNAFLRNGLCDGIHWGYLQQEGTFWRKSLWDKVGGLDATFRLAGDWDLWRRMALHAEYTHLPWPMGIFRKRPGQLSQNIGLYQAEIAQRMSLAERRKALREVLREKESLQYSTIAFTDTGIVLERRATPVIDLKMWIRLRLCVNGLYKHMLIQGIKRLLRLLNNMYTRYGS